VLLNLYSGVWYEEAGALSITSTNAAIGGGDHGTGYVLIDNAWVKGLKSAKLRIEHNQPGSAATSVIKVAAPRTAITAFGSGTAAVASSAISSQSVRSVITTYGCPIVNSSAHLFHSTSIVSRYNGSCETLSIDEVIAILEMAAA
jgi:hypothetical protein